MYDSVAGRFCSRDPIAFSGSPWLLYEYVKGMSLIKADPSGLIAPAIPVVVGGGIGIAALKAAALAAGVSIYYCLLTPKCLGDAKDRTIETIEDKIEDIWPWGNNEPVPTGDQRVDIIVPPKPPKDPNGDSDSCNCCEWNMECGHQYMEVQNCMPMPKSACESVDGRSCMPPSVKNGDRTMPRKGPDGEDWPYSPNM